jgi:HAD superfamily hydrolase (TIGR01509 family)
MKNLSDIKAVIFDFDGTIGDSAYVWDDVDKHFFERRGMTIPPDYTERISTLNMYDCATFTKTQYNLPESTEEIMAEWQAASLREYEQNVRLKPYAADYIRKLKAQGIKIAIATSALPAYYVPVLKKEGVYDLFDNLTDGSMGLNGKHTPDMFLHCAKALGVPCEDCCVFEDIQPAIESAKSIGMYTVAVFEKRSQDVWDKVKQAADENILGFKELL